MRLADVLAQIPGVTKRFVHYLEAQGHITPTLIQKERIARRDYSERDVQRIRAIWTYYRRGFSVLNAVEAVDQGDLAIAYVMFQIPARRWRQTLDLLRQFDNVLSASLVYGELEDIVVKLRAPDDGDIYSVLGAVLREAAITGQPTIMKVARQATIDRERVMSGGDSVQAYVLIKASAKQIEKVLEELRELDGIAEASAIYGETDVICRVDVPTQHELDRLVMDDLHAIPAVESTRTFIVISDLHWRR